MELAQLGLKTGQIIKTTSASGIPFLRHYGIIVVENNETFVLHNSPKTPSVKEPLANWQGKRRIIDVANTPLMQLSVSKILDRFDNFCQRPYNLFTYNCEHFLTCMLGMKPSSPQLKRVTLGTIFFLLILRNR